MLDRAARLGPSGVGRQDQCRDTVRGSHRRLNRLGRILADVVGGGGRFDPLRDRLGHRDDVRGQRGVILQMVCGVIPDNVNHRGKGAAGVVEIGKAVPQAWTEMEQSRGRFAAHLGVAGRRAGRASFKEVENRPHIGHIVECRHKMHFRRSGIGETDLNPAVYQSFN